MTDTTAIATIDKSLELRGLTHQSFRVLQQIVWPNTSRQISQEEHDHAVLMAVDYCKARNLDPFKKPVHIVPTYSAKADKMVLTMWPGINDYRTTAFRTGQFAGKDPTSFGPTVKKTFGVGGEAIEIEYPDWAQVTVYRLVGGIKCAFPGPKVYWRETYATASKNTTKPNAMWSRRPYGQIEKCAEAAALRAAFPEEIGSQPTAEEMEGKIVDGEIMPSESATIGASLGQEEVDTILRETDEEIAQEMASMDDHPPAARTAEKGTGLGPAPASAASPVPAGAAAPASGGGSGTPPGRRGAEDSVSAPSLPPAPSAANPSAKAQGSPTATAPPSSGAPRPAGDDDERKPTQAGIPFTARDTVPSEPATDAQREEYLALIKRAKESTAAELAFYMREKYGLDMDDDSLWSFVHFEDANRWLRTRKAAKAGR